LNFPEPSFPLFSQTETFFVEVILPLALPKCYTYRVPQELNDRVGIGRRVVVQFGKKRIYSALIKSIGQDPPRQYEAKYILSVLDEHPVVTPLQFRFWDWLSEYYMCTPGEVMSAALPAGLKLESESLIIRHPSATPDGIELDDREYLIMEALEVNREITVKEVMEILDLKNVFPYIKSLYEKGQILMKEELREGYRPKKTACVRLMPEYSEEEQLKALFETLEKHPKQLALLMAWLSLSYQQQTITKSELLKSSNIGEGVLKTLLNKNVFEIYHAIEDRIKKKGEEGKESFTLNEMQQNVLEDVKQQFLKKEVVLLHGVTSSGKTHIYARLMEEAIQQGRQVLYLLPEIALTSQVISRLRKYFGDVVAVSHSRFSDSERVEIWNRVKEGKTRIVLGARSAVFLPFADLSLVIVDEEHETSYKQFEPAPRYHARDAAIYLASLNGAKVLLGSATPSFESYLNAIKGKYGLISMTERFGGTALPEIITADLSEETRKKMIKGNFSSVLLQGIDSAMEAREQVILFQNRRGYVPVLECGLCGWSPRCKNCDISMTYHKYQEQLRCHYCGYSGKPPVLCEACGSTHIRFLGLGTEKVEDDLALLLPTVRISRLDLDAAKGKTGPSRIIRDFEERKTDILIGTQMVTKGLDFENVSLVGIISADQLLNFPDFRAFERAFQLMSQVAGRAGRRDKQGKVIIQTFRPGHQVIKSVIEHDFPAFFNQEIRDRETFKYPPFFRLIKIAVKNKDQVLAQQAAEQLATLLRNSMGSRVLGPEIPYVPRIRNLYIRNIMVKIGRGDSLPKVKAVIRTSIETLSALKDKKTVSFIIDVDPY
jgi:primosomal protein N' (replication factor Y)